MTARQIQMEVCALHGLRQYELVRSGNQAKFVAARSEAMTRCRDELGMSYTQIGRMFGRHHTSVIHAIAGHRQHGPEKRIAKRKKPVLEDAIARQARVIASQGRMIAEQARQIETLAGEVGDLAAAGLRANGQQELFQGESA